MSWFYFEDQEPRYRKGREVFKAPDGLPVRVMEIDHEPTSF